MFEILLAVRFATHPLSNSILVFAISIVLDKTEKKPNSEESFAVMVEEFAKIFLQNPKLINFIKQCTKQNDTS